MTKIESWALVYRFAPELRYCVGASGPRRNEWRQRRQQPQNLKIAWAGAAGINERAMVTTSAPVISRLSSLPGAHKFSLVDQMFEEQ